MIHSPSLPNPNRSFVVPGLEEIWHSLSASPMKMGLFAIVVALQVADVITTNHGLMYDGIWEANPFISFLMTHFGSCWWIPVKVGFILYLLMILPKIRLIWPLMLII